MKITITLLLLFLAGCQSKNKDRMEDLEYLERLYQVRYRIEYKEKIRVFDSLILVQEKRIDKL